MLDAALSLKSTRAPTWGVWTSWYSLAIIATTLPAAWLGARLQEK